jgi:hypothetical protein
LEFLVSSIACEFEPELEVMAVLCDIVDRVELAAFKAERDVAADIERKRRRAERDKLGGLKLPRTGSLQRHAYTARKKMELLDTYDEIRKVRARASCAPALAVSSSRALAPTLLPLRALSVCRTAPSPTLRPNSATRRAWLSPSSSSGPSPRSALRSRVPPGRSARRSSCASTRRAGALASTPRWRPRCTRSSRRGARARAGAARGGSRLPRASSCESCTRTRRAPSRLARTGARASSRVSALPSAAARTRRTSLGRRRGRCSAATSSGCSSGSSIRSRCPSPPPRLQQPLLLRTAVLAAALAELQLARVARRVGLDAGAGVGVGAAVS